MKEANSQTPSGVHLPNTHQLIISKEPVYAPLKEWMDLYTDQLANNTTFTIYADSDGYQVVKCSKVLDNELFFYLVNYLALACPVVHRKEVRGYTTGTDAPELSGKKLMVYIPDEEKEYDNVTAITPNDEAYFIDFGGKITPASPQDCFIAPPELSHFTTVKTLRVRNVKPAGRTEKSNPLQSTSIAKKLILAIIGIIVLFLLIVMMQSDYRFFLPLLLFVYLSCDYQRLRKLKGYLILFGTTIACTLLFAWARNHYEDTLIEFFLFFPLSLLLIQPPLRGLFIALVEREPVVEKPAPSIADFLYTIALLGGSAGVGYLLNQLLG